MTRRRARRLACGLGAVALLGGTVHEAAAQVSLDEPPLGENDAKRLDRIEKAVRELRAIVFQGRETGQPVVVQPADTEGQINQQSDKLNDLDQTLAKLTGELEVVRHDVDQTHHDLDDLRSQNAALKDQVDGLQKTVQALQPPPPPPAGAPTASPGGLGAPGSPPVEPPSTAPLDPAAQFSAARAALEQGDMANAEAGFQAYIAVAGDGPRGPEARYYLARTLIARKAWPEAATADIGAIRGWPHTSWAPAAVLDLSRSLVAMGKNQDACETLGELTQRYPGAAPAVLREARRLRTDAQCP
ncbi:MAG TPA: tetratricopeptide repeat protein [Caulobacteraceae bacterium]|nr:tetratricopeptide repeat protein [Caulobacteraceae bacterium]